MSRPSIEEENEQLRNRIQELEAKDAGSLSTCWTGKPELPERDVLARSAAEYADIIVDLESRNEALQAEVTRLSAQLEAQRTDCDEFGQYTRANKLQKDMESAAAHLSAIDDMRMNAELARIAAESRANAAEAELADLRGRVLLCQRRYAAGCSRESMAEALNEAVQTLVLVSKAEQSELEALRGRVARVKTAYAQLPAIPQYCDLKPFATTVMAILEDWATAEVERDR